MNNYSDSAEKAPIIQVIDLKKDYETGAEVISVLKGIELSLYPGEIMAIMGPSGEGKSTFLFIMGLLMPPTSGEYRALGQDIFKLNRSEQAEFRRKFAGFVFQSCNLFEHTTVYENLEFPLIYAGVNRKERPKMIHEALERVNMSHRINQPTNRLSGGEQQRVSIARALVNRPRVIFADEPTGQLDRKNSKQVMTHFHKFANEGEAAMILVTHDPDVAAQCSRTAHLREGYLHFEESPQG